MRSVNNWAVAAVFAAAIAFAVPSWAQTAGGQAGGQSGGTGQTTGGQQGGSTSGGQQGTGTDTGSGTATAGATASQPSSKQGNLQKFVDQAAISNMAEIQLGQLAQQKSQDPQVKQFAQTMIDQHTQAENQLQQVASANGVNLPSSLDKKHQKIQDKLAKLEGPQFDREYMKVMVDAHRNTEKLLQKEANRQGGSPASSQASGSVGTSGSSAGASGTAGTSTSGAVGTSGQATSIDQYASMTLPQVQQHLQMAKDLEAQVKNQGKSNKSSDKYNDKGGK